MEIVENTLESSIDEVLARPLFCFLGTTAPTGEPRVSPLWFLWEDEYVWILGDTVGKSYTGRIEARPESAVAVVDAEPTSGRVHHVGMRGRAELVALDADRVRRLLGNYLGDDPDQWDPRFVDLDPERWSFVRFSPETVVARDQSFAPSLADE
ncbi:MULTISPECIES: pyridoxamine 5'-phosphate oxidase family protein [Halomicrobium]|uniref:Pyridoxamine 5'-phosphate oxidase-related FMN-binding n=2 Tax=Halomicrobium mukohataei TaxID=57705 RepID=C7P1Y9_HALMD|nr:MULTISPECIES: pyridoxamine 5'-phosphate oxidase family protein [Halomicrobium]ACV47218.1 pyridoxamine 5'-phosphate oxidase-related FMN- binding [Halomicrobium mukohataei DSM 12286]QCD65691.1 pyridoxamine 5'-phosphate oxidase family protein [Halomicrobium mukohataei]QFR20497.1 pyridoxamine 5'-phosphate oxidase family protein [Halomicrobium sp. ZPS1]